MKQFFKMFAMLIIVVAVLGMAACGKNKSANAKSNENSNAPGVVSVELDENGNPVSTQGKTEPSGTGSNSPSEAQENMEFVEATTPPTLTPPKTGTNDQTETSTQTGSSAQTGAAFNPVTKPEQKRPPWETGGKKPSNYTLADHMALPKEHQEAFYKWFGFHEDFMKWAYGVQENSTSVQKAPWEFVGSKPSSEYTWKEYEALTAEHRIAFSKSFNKIDAFAEWLTNNQPNGGEENVYLPWENGGKQPSEYTWAEFEALDAGQQTAFQKTFSNLAAFKKWMEKVNPDSKEKLPWENGGKQPSEYTWDEYKALNASLQIAFQESFSSPSAFEKWKEMVNPTVKLPWENGGKQPSEYTWAEFEALDAGQQIAFQETFGSLDAFERWMQKVNPEDKVKYPWENGGKQPSEYTWAEFEALDAGQQIGFQESFGSIDAFRDWMEQVNPDEETDVYLPWENGGKQPSEYTWAEFEALDAGQQTAFQNSFGGVDGFNAWLQSVQPDDTIYLPWEHGGKHPSEYTWEEFDALDAGQQTAFQNAFDSFEAFDQWLTANQPIG